VQNLRADPFVFFRILALCDRSFSILIHHYSIIFVTASLLLNGGHGVQARAPAEGEPGAKKNETNAMHYHCVRTGTEKIGQRLEDKRGQFIQILNFQS
jgi:hypothetical protein